MPGAAAAGSEPQPAQVGPVPGSVAPAPNPSPVRAPGSPLSAGQPGFSPNAGETMGSSLSIGPSVKNPSEVGPLPRPLNQGHVMTTTQPWLDMPHNPNGPPFQRPLEEF